MYRVMQLTLLNSVMKFWYDKNNHLGFALSIHVLMQIKKKREILECKHAFLDHSIQNHVKIQHSSEHA